MQNGFSARPMPCDAQYVEATAFLDHRDSLRRYALSLTRARSEADDLVQETLVRALQVRADGREIRNPRPYLMRLLHNLHIDQCRARPRTDAADAEAEAVSGGQETRQTLREVLAALDALSPEHRAMLRMAAEGLSYAEMTVALDVPAGTVTSRLSRARAALRARLGWGPGQVLS